MSIRVMTHVWHYSVSKGEALLVLLALADSADDTGYCWPSMESLATKARVSVRGARGIIGDLQRSGQIRYTPGVGRGRRSSFVVLTENRNLLPLLLKTKPERGSSKNRNVATRKPEGRRGDIRRTVRNRHIEPSDAGAVDKSTGRGLRSLGSVLAEAQRRAERLEA